MYLLFLPLANRVPSKIVDAVRLLARLHARASTRRVREEMHS